MKFIIFISALLFVACGGPEKRDLRSDPQDNEINRLKETVLELQGTVAQINAFVASDFSSCSPSLPAFEAKICNIAQTATAEQRLLFTQQLAQLSKMFQTELYGEDCSRNETSAFDVGCPIAGSILDRLDSIESDVGANDAIVTGLQADVLTLQADVAGLSSRLNDFNGSGQSIEVVIAGVQSSISSMESRLDDIEETLNSADLWKHVSVCSDVTPTTGPLFESLLVRGDRQSIVGYIATNAVMGGLGTFAEAGSGDKYERTTLNTRTCRFMVYDLDDGLNVCWKNNDRNASQGQINSACDRTNDLANPTSACTCAF